MKREIALLLFSCLAALGTAQERTVKGKVTDGKSPMENVYIQILDKEVSATTDAKGAYEIAVDTGDRIQYTFTGMKTITIRIEDITKILNPVMVPDVEELEEVVVEASKRRSQKDLEEDYAINDRIIRTAYGYIDADRAPGNLRILTDDEISPVNLCILDLLRNRFAGLVVAGDCRRGGEVFNGRGSRSGPMIWDVDGIILANQGPGIPSAPIWLDINNIKRIAVINNLAMSTQYGGLGDSGVIVINTIAGSPRQGEIVDRARLRNNYADGLELSREEVAKNAPTYLKEMRSSGSFEESRAIFERYHRTYSNSPYFLLDAYVHFVEDHGQEDYADGIVSEHFGPYAKNPVLMKALAYTYESQQRYEKANEAYKEVFILRPNYVQSYMDMANSYRNLREAKQAASMYARYDYLIEEGFLERDTIGFGPVMEREFNNLLMLEKGSVVDGRKARKLFVAEEGFQGTRLVFEWNDGEAEFDLQFVNPENQYHKWKHSMADNADEVAREKDFGYNVKEYLVDGSLPGTWKVNVNYLGNKSLTPTYLKATIYYDYGLRTQRKETMVFKLDLRNVNQELFSLTTGGKVALR